MGFLLYGYEVGLLRGFKFYLVHVRVLIHFELISDVSVAVYLEVGVLGQRLHKVLLFLLVSFVNWVEYRRVDLVASIKITVMMCSLDLIFIRLGFITSKVVYPRLANTKFNITSFTSVNSPA